MIYVYKIVLLLLKLFYKIEIHGEDKLNTKGAVIYCPNHFSNLDPILVGAIMKEKIYFMAKKELFKGIILKKLIYTLGGFPVDRKQGGKKAIEETIKKITQDKKVCIFPHGKRIKFGEDSEIKNGALVAAKDTGVPIIPVQIYTDYKFRHKVVITLCEPIYIKDENDLKIKKEELKNILG